MNFTSSPGVYFWSNGYSYGTCEVSDTSVRLKVIKGSLNLKTLTLTGRKKAVAEGVVLSEGESGSFRI